jgi:cytochrome c-type biogenesis protein CcmH
MTSILALWLLTLSSTASARELYQFPDAQSQVRFATLTHNFRCLVCQNQTIADSQAPLAADLRQKVYEQILSHHSDEQISLYLTQRYGEFILYSPPIEPKTWLLWFLPAFLLILGIMGLTIKFILNRPMKKTLDL